MAVTDDEFSEFVAARWATIFRVAYLLAGTRNDAEELAQAALARVYGARGRITDADHLEAYTRQTLTHEHVSEVRRRIRGREQSIELRPRSDSADDVASREMLRSALALIPPGQRAVLVLRFYEDMTIAEVAATLGCSTGSVKKQTHRALSKLAHLVSDSSFDEGRRARHG